MTFTITYEPRRFAGEDGYWYQIRSRGRVVGEGWSRGKKHHAERSARADVRERERKAS